LDFYLKQFQISKNSPGEKDPKIKGNLLMLVYGLIQDSKIILYFYYFIKIIIFNNYSPNYFGNYL
jgi:hypothetical protein